MNAKKDNLKKTKPKPIHENDEEELEDDKDYGGLPDDADLRKNLGCG